MAISYKEGYETYRRYYQEIRKTTEKPVTRIYTTAVFSFLAVSLFALYAIKPTIATILYLRREIADKSVINTKMEDKISNLIEAQASYEAASQQIQLVNEALPKNPDIVSLASQLRTITEQSGASLSGIRTQPMALSADANVSTSETKPTPTPSANATAQTAPSTPKDKLVPLSLNLIAVGNYSAVKTILDTIMTMRRIVTIDRVSITPLQQQGGHMASGSGNLQLDLKLNAYMFSPEK